MWRVSWVAETGSTNDDVLAAAARGEPEGYVLVAGHQTGGRGRLGRSWDSPKGASLALSCLLRPVTVPAARWPWLPLLVGVAAREALAEAASVPVGLKWPNDLQVGDAKLGGILVERVDTLAGPAAIAGLGVNLTAAPPGAAALLPASGATPSAQDLVDALLDRIRRWYEHWQAEPSSVELRHAYRAACGTLGRDVRVALPGGGMVTGRVAEIDDDGRLVVDTVSGTVSVGAGDIVHLRVATT